MTLILPQVEELISTLKQLMPTIYQQETLESILGLLLSGKGNAVPHHCQTKDGRKVSELKTRGQQVYLNGLDIPVFLSWVWLKRDGKRVQRFVISTKSMKGKTIARWGKRRWQIEGFFKTIKHCFSLHRFGEDATPELGSGARVVRQKTLLGVCRWLILSFISYLLSYWVYLHLGDLDDLDWFSSAQQALILLLPHILLLSLLNKLKTVISWLNELGFDFSLIRCKI